jgi:hypothetical protein
MCVGGRGEVYTKLQSEHPKGRDKGDILELIKMGRKQKGNGSRLGLSNSGWNSFAVFCEHGNETSRSLQLWNLLTS